MILMKNAKKVSFVELILAQTHLVLTLKQIAVMKNHQSLEMKIFVQVKLLAVKTKVTVIHMRNVKMI